MRVKGTREDCAHDTRCWQPQGMKKWRIEYRSKYTETPLSFWVHKHVDHEVWRHANKFDPELPKAIPGKGYPVLIVKVLGVELEFSSVPEVEHFLFVISQKNMPSTRQLSLQRIHNYGPNRHWLSRLPSSIKPWTKRARIIPIVEGALNEFKTVCAYSAA